MLQVNKLSFKSVFTPFFLLIFSAMFLSTLTDQFIASRVELLVSSRDGLSNMIFFWGAFSLISAIFFPLMFAVLCSYSIVRKPNSTTAQQFIEDNIELSIIETLRAWGKSFLWTFVLIFPGLWKFVLFALTPYVVLFSKKYKSGKVDALEYSTLICKKNFKQVNLWLGVFYVAVPILIYVVAEPYRLLKDNPIAGTVIVLIRTLSEYCFHYMMLRFFITFINQNENEAVSETATAQV